MEVGINQTNSNKYYYYQSYLLCIVSKRGCWTCTVVDTEVYHTFELSGGEALVDETYIHHFGRAHKFVYPYWRGSREKAACKQRLCTDIHSSLSLINFLWRFGL